MFWGVFSYDDDDDDDIFMAFQDSGPEVMFAQRRQ